MGQDGDWPIRREVCTAIKQGRPATRLVLLGGTGGSRRHRPSHALSCAILFDP